MTIDCRQDRGLGTTRSPKAIQSEKNQIQPEIQHRDKMVTTAMNISTFPQKVYNIAKPVCACEPEFTHENISLVASKSLPQPVAPNHVPLKVQILNKIVHLGKNSNCEWVTLVNELSKALPALKKPCKRITTTGARRSLVPRPSFVRFPIMKPCKDEPITITKIEPNYGPVCGGTTVRLHLNNINMRSIDNLSILFGKTKITNFRSVSPSVVCFIVPSYNLAKKRDVSVHVQDGFHSDRYCLKLGFEYVSMDTYLERKNKQDRTISWDNGPHMPVTLVNNALSNELDNSIQLVQVKLGDTILEDVTKSIATNKNYITQIYLNVNSVYKLHLNSILYDYEWETDNNMVSVICNGERKAMILENGTVVLRLLLAIMNEQSNVHLMLRQRSTRTIVFDTLVKQLVAQGDKVVHNKFIIEKLYSKHIESPLFLSNVLGQTEMHQCCVSGDLNELSRLRSTWDTYANCFNMIVCARDHFLRNAFHLAFAFGHLEVTKYLIYRVGVEMASDLLLQRDYFGMTPFHLAAHYRHKQFLSSLCSWMNCYAFAHQATEQVYVPQVSQKTFTPVIVPNASSLSVINLIGDEDCEMSEAKVKVNRKEAPQKRKRESSYAANKKIRKESPKLDNPMVM